MKEILFGLLSAIEDLRANQAVIVARIGTGVRIDDARDAKTAAARDSHEFYKELRTKIESLE